MQTHPKQEGSEGFARLDRVILGLLVSRYRQPWSDAEIERAIGGKYGSISEAVQRLNDAGLVHCWDEFVSATHASIRNFELMEPPDAGSAFEHHWDQLILELLIGLPDERLSEKEIIRKTGAKDTGEQLAVVDALARLDGAGLVDRPDGLASASPTAIRFDQIMDL
jgi:hypothetical protein